jgi:hypothetical protein
MLGDDDSLGTVPTHSLKIPDWVVVLDHWAEHVAPAASDALSHQIVIDFPVLPYGLEVRPISWVAVPGGIQAKVCPVAPRVVIRMIEVHDIVQLVGRHQKGAVIVAIWTYAAVSVFS